MTDYFYDMDLVVDPLNPSNVVANGLVSIYDPADTAGTTLLALKDPSGLPLPNPLPSNANGFLPPRSATVPQTMWKSGGFTGYFNSYKGLRDESVAAVSAAQSAANDAATSAAEVVTTATVDGSGNLVLTKASGATVNAGVVKGAKGDTGATGAKGADGSNVLPTDTAIQQAINDTASATRGALNATYVPVDNGRAIDLSLPPYSLSTSDSPAQVKTKIESAVSAAAGREVILPAGDWTAALSFTDQDVNLTGPGRLVQAFGTSAIKVQRTPGAAKTVTAVSTLRIGPVATFGTEVNSTVAMAQSDMADLKAGDPCLLFSQDAYADDLLVTGSNLKTYSTSWFPILGFSLIVGSITGTEIAEGNTITSAGGASGVVTGVVADGATRTVILSSFTGMFTVGEAVSVAGTQRGTVSATPLVVMAGKLRDSHATSPVLRKMPTASCRIHTRIKASGDSFTADPNRGYAIDLQGVVYPNLKVDVTSTWAQGVCFTSTLGGTAEVTVSGGQPNMAQLTEQAYGYAVLAQGATEGLSLKVSAKNVRHAFTTGVHVASAYPAGSLLRTGIPKDCRVYDSIAWAPTAAGFDTHHGAYDIVFDNCVTVGTRSGGRAASSSAGFNNRSWGTVFRNCDAYDVVDAFTEQVSTVFAPRANRVRYINCNAYRYQRFGFSQAGITAKDALSVVEYQGCTAEGDGSAANAPHFQVGFYASLGYAVRWTRCESRLANDSLFRIDAAASVINRNCYGDLEGSPIGAKMLNYIGNPAENVIHGFTYRVDPANPTALGGVIRVDATSVTATIDGIKCTSGNTRELFYSTGVGSLTWGVPVERARELYGTATWDPVSLAAGAQASTTVNVNGAQVGDLVQSVSHSAGLAGCILSAQVTATNTVTVWITNLSGAVQDVASGTLRVMARRRPF